MKLLLPIIIISFVFVACAGGGSPTAAGTYTAYSPRQIAENIIEEQMSIAAMSYLVPGDEFFWEYITNRYQIDPCEIEILDGIIFYAGGVIVDEIAVLLLADEAKTSTVRDLLLAYADRRRIAFSGYAPIQAGILADARVSVNGNHVALLITEDSRAAEFSFLDCFVEEEPLEEEPLIEIEEIQKIEEFEEIEELEEIEEEVLQEYIPEYFPEYIENDAYDRRAIVKAWHSGDPSNLTPMNRRIFDKCAYIISTEITPYMSDYARQLAIINWIITWSVYDPDFLSNSPTAQPDPNNDNPYGVLFSGVGNCFGFTFTFQLFMELLGIESMVVYGYDFTGGRHAWNLVNIYDNWYAVDVTLDVTLNNPIGSPVGYKPESIQHRHLNVTSEYLWNVLGHYWDWWSVPIAE